MFFTRIGKVIPHLIFWLGLLNLAGSFFVAFSPANMESKRAAASHYLGAATSG